MAEEIWANLLLTSVHGCSSPILIPLQCQKFAFMQKKHFKLRYPTFFSGACNEVFSQCAVATNRQGENAALHLFGELWRRSNPAPASLITPFNSLSHIVTSSSALARSSVQVCPATSMTNTYNLIIVIKVKVRSG